MHFQAVNPWGAPRKYPGAPALSTGSRSMPIERILAVNLVLQIPQMQIKTSLTAPSRLHLQSWQQYLFFPSLPY